jgi:hypothetical protein
MLPRLSHPFPARLPTHSLYPHRPCTSCVKRACTERCKYRSELDFVPPPDPPSKPSVTLLLYSTHPPYPPPPTSALNNGHDPPYRLVSQSCIEVSPTHTSTITYPFLTLRPQCSNQRVKCDRKEPCGSCIKRGLAAECTYANLTPLPT